MPLKLLFSIGFLEVRLVSILDIVLVTILLYNLYRLSRGGVALKIFIGFLALYLFFLVVKATEMELLSTILGQFMNVGVIAAIILFQQEIRKFLLYIGKTANFNQFKLYNLIKINTRSLQNSAYISSILEALQEMKNTKTGGLIVLSKHDNIGTYTETGDIIDAALSKRLLLSIFFKNSPLHDGAAIIQNGRILAARCILPISENNKISANLGLRHRAGIGITEQVDVAVLVVSEETGYLSFIEDGKISVNLSISEIQRRINTYLFYQPKMESEKEKVFQKGLLPVIGT